MEGTGALYLQPPGCLPPARYQERLPFLLECLGPGAAEPVSRAEVPPVIVTYQETEKRLHMILVEC